jgi:predicted Zn-dependent protease
MEIFELLRADEGIRAASAAERLVELHPDSLGARTAFAWIASWKSVHEEAPGLAESTFREAIRLGESSILVRAANADYLAMDERYREALRESDRALEIEPGNVFTRLTRLRTLRNLDPDRAEEYGRSLVEESPEIPDYWNELANVYEALEKYSEQADALMTAEELSPPPHPRGPVAHALAKAGRLDEAEERFKKNVDDHACQWCWFAYAKFLIEHRPERGEDARAALQKVEEMRDQALIEESEIEAWRERLEGTGESPVAEP